ncbi:MAG TPA: glycosyltransferase family 4 protein [Candidatus Acidoferrales bacterium]|nr:glycosyltransferase family 4 protein [Candidatus Acidoferrales bacterium]
MQGAEPELDPDFEVEVKWDIPLLDGYSWVHLPNRFGPPKLGSFFGLVNTGIWKLIRQGHFDAVVVYTGYVYATFWIALAAAKARGTAILFGTDAHDLAPRDASRWKRRVKKWLWPRLFRLADIVPVVSTGGVRLMRSFGIPEERIALVPFCVDNDWWAQKTNLVNRQFVRTRWRVPADAPVVLFCAKLQPWKRPSDLLRAFAKANDPAAYLVFAGDGALRTELEDEAASLGISDRVRFIGFVNQTGLPEVYTASDILVLPSEYEPFGLVVNEAMLCHCPAIVSDRVGAKFDLVRDGETGYVFPCGEVDVLAQTLRRVLGDQETLRKMGEAARARMANWSHADYARALVGAIAKAVEVRDGSAGRQFSSRG